MEAESAVGSGPIGPAPPPASVPPLPPASLEGPDELPPEELLDDAPLEELLEDAPLDELLGRPPPLEELPELPRDPLLEPLDPLDPPEPLESPPDEELAGPPDDPWLEDAAGLFKLGLLPKDPASGCDELEAQCAMQNDPTTATSGNALFMSGAPPHIHHPCCTFSQCVDGSLFYRPRSVSYIGRKFASSIKSGALVGNS